MAATPSKQPASSPSSDEEAAGPGALIPDCLLLDIFMQMPARSVARCRCLSRYWAAALAPSDDFTARHFLAANRRPSLFVLPVPTTGGVTSVPVWTPDRPAGATLAAFPGRKMRNAGTRPCRGLVVMEAEELPATGTGAVYYVCNPSTGQMTALPNDRGRPSGGHDSLGIGYDATAGNHKVVRVSQHRDRHDSEVICEVFVVGSGSTEGYWRPPASGGTPRAWLSSYEPSVFARGRLYWMSEAEGAFGTKHVVSFSVSDETFGIVQQPRRFGKYRLTELGGRACLFTGASSPRRCYDIWLLRDDYNKDYDAEAWDLHCRIELGVASPEVKRFMSCFVRPLAFIDDGRRILFRPGFRRTNDDKHIHQLCAYDPATGVMEELLADGSLIAQPSVNGTATTKAVVYEESLVSTGRPHEDIIFAPASAQALSMALCLLPARDLGRLKLVCRSWRAMMETSRFIKLYTRHASTRRRLSDDPLRVFFPKEAYRSSAGSDQPPQLLEQRVVSSKPCHGLLAVGRSDHQVSVLNPATGEEINYGFHDSDYVTRKDQNSVTVCHGLGYDEDHVVVTTVVSRSGSMKECWLRRMKEGGKIRTVKSAPPVHAWLDVPPVFVHGKMYWMGNNSMMIMALDIQTEAFEVLPGPLIDLDNDHGRMLVAELGGELCVAHSCPNTETMTIWTKTTETTEEGQAGWKRELVMELRRWPEFSPKTSAGLVVPVEVDGDGKVLLDTGREAGVYDPRNKTMRTVYSLKWSHGDLADKFVAAALWEDSLVAPPDGPGERRYCYRDV